MKLNKIVILSAVVVAGAAVVFMATRGGAKMIEPGSKVQIHYKLTVDGQVVDSSEGKDPLEFVQGEGKIIPGLEKELVGLKKGDEKEVEIAPEQAYGQHNPNLLQQVPKEQVGNAEALQRGSVLTAKNEQGQTFQGIVVELNDSTITIDFNHPLAGKNLHFNVQIVSVN